jgi:carbamoyltransferase
LVPGLWGHRSILADPREAENKTRINAMVKKREGYRPFAPSVILEAADEFFELAQQPCSFGYMVFTVKVKEDKRKLLGATTHIDGTSRIQTVSKDVNSKYWNLINQFGQLTQVPILLNTSFNNNVEPIVNSCLDAITCFMTTNLDYLVIDDFLVSKLNFSWKDYYLNMTPYLVPSAALREVNQFNSQEEKSSYHEIYFNYAGGKSLLIMPETYQVLVNIKQHHTISQVANDLNLSAEKSKDITEDLSDFGKTALLLCSPTRVAQLKSNFIIDVKFKH